MEIERIDHIVLTVKDIDVTVKFYTEIMGFTCITFNNDRKALVFGNQKINLHKKGKEFEPKADLPTCGSADLCFVAKTDINGALVELKNKGVEIIEGIVERSGAKGKIKSIYFRDPDKNLIEVCNYI